ncbi:MAG: PqqD family protein [Lachnospiraceae bacterium]|nr:PqqD family protein [Lachnospiraceae bacterium]
MKAKKDFILRNVAGEFMLVPTGDEIKSFNGTLMLNEQAAFVWEKLQSSISRKVLLDDILNEYDTDEKTAAQDLDDLLTSFLDLGIIEK